MSATYINLDPIAQSIRSFGSGLANNALKKAQLDRQYAQDMVAFDKAQADIDYTNARNQREAEKHAAWARVADAMDLSQLNPVQRSLIGINASAGRNVSHDAALAADKILNPGGSSSRQEFSLPTLMRLYQKEVIDPITGKAAVSQSGQPIMTTDKDLFSKHYKYVHENNLPKTNETFLNLLTGVLTIPEVQQAIDGTGVAPQTNLPTQTANQPKVGPIDIPSMHDVIVQMYRLGDISYEQAVELGKQFGVPL